MSTIEKPSNLEDEYFTRENAERLRKLHADEERRLRADEKEALRRLHAGRCAGCGSQMIPETVGGLRIQHCPGCGGAFLERSAWDHLHQHTEPASVMGAVLNWFKAANKP